MRLPAYIVAGLRDYLTRADAALAAHEFERHSALLNEMSGYLARSLDVHIEK